MRTKKLSVFRPMLAAIFGAMLLVSTAQAVPAPAVTFANSYNPGGIIAQAETVGWTFTVAGGPLTVTSLGVFDNHNTSTVTWPQNNTPDGLVNSHDVGIWDTSGNRLAFATVNPTDPTVFIVNQFDYVSLVSPVVLNPGAYVIGATWLAGNDNSQGATADHYASGASITPGSFQTSGISYGKDMYIESTSLTMPTKSQQDQYADFDPAMFGPNFEFTTATAAVPEPGTMMLLGAGFLGLAVYGKRRQNA